VTSRVALRDGGSIAYEDRGREVNDAPPLLLIGPLGGAMTLWSAFADALAERLRVIAFDARGTGRSSDARWSTTTRSMAADAIAVLDALAVARAHVYGISLGGMVATRLAIDSPTRVARRVLASTTPKIAVTQSRSIMPALRLLTRAQPTSRRSLALLLAAALRHDARAELEEIRAETLVIMGERDRVVPRSAQRDLERIPRSRVVTISGAGHDVSAEAPAHVARAVLDHVLWT
jgi:3-oxoadipate enol-lactonase